MEIVLLITFQITEQQIQKEKERDNLIPLTDTCLLCLSIQYMSCPLILPTASYHRVSAGSTPEGGHWLFPQSASGARMFDSILHSAW